VPRNSVSLFGECYAGVKQKLKHSLLGAATWATSVFMVAELGSSWCCRSCFSRCWSGWKEKTGWLCKKSAKIFEPFCPLCRLSPFIRSDRSHSLKPSYTIDSIPPPISFHIPPNPNSATVKMEATDFSETLENIYFSTWCNNSNVSHLIYI